MRVGTVMAVVASSLLACGVAWASETITYTYDARGRLLTVNRMGSVNNGVVANYTYDRADNRKRVVVTGSPNTP